MKKQKSKKDVSTQDYKIDPNGAEIEKLSYSKMKLNRLHKLRQKAQKKGFEIPYLKFPLDRTKKIRVAILLIAIISALESILLLGGIGYGLFAISVYFRPLMVQVPKEIVQILLLLFALLIFSLILMYVKVFLQTSIKLFKMSRFSMQEMAINEETHYITAGCIRWMLACVLLFFLVADKFPQTLKQGFIIGAIITSVIFIVYVIIVKVNEKQARKRFDQLPEEERNSYIEHFVHVCKATMKSKREKISRSNNN